MIHCRNREVYVINSLSTKKKVNEAGVSAEFFVKPKSEINTRRYKLTNHANISWQRNKWLCFCLVYPPASLVNSYFLFFKKIVLRTCAYKELTLSESGCVCPISPPPFQFSIMNNQLNSIILIHSHVLSVSPSAYLSRLNKWHSSDAASCFSLKSPPSALGKPKCSFHIGMYNNT